MRIATTRFSSTERQKIILLYELNDLKLNWTILFIKDVKSDKCEYFPKLKKILDKVDIFLTNKLGFYP